MSFYTKLPHYNQLIKIGKFTKSFGINGLVKFYSYSGITNFLSEIKQIYLIFQDELQVFTIEYWLLENPLRCKVLSFETPESVNENLIGKEVLIPRESLNEFLRLYNNELNPEEYFIADLEHLQVVSNNTVLGCIEGVYTDAYAPLFEIVWNNKTKSMIPFIKEYFDLPNLKNNSIELLATELINPHDEN